MNQSESTTLYFTQGSSDKIYSAFLDETDAGYLVSFEYGRRGKPLRRGQKTPQSLPYDEAKKVYDKLIAGKKSKGYTEDNSGETFMHTDSTNAKTDWIPQLFNPTTLDEIKTMFLRYPMIALQIKYDGERRGILFGDHPGEIIGANRKGLEVGLREDILEALKELDCPPGTILDCEDMGDHLQIFDIIDTSRKEFQKMTFQIRERKLHRLENQIKKINQEERLRVVDTVFMVSFTMAHQVIEQFRERNEEGVILRSSASLYTPGRPASGGDARKHKFVETASVRAGAGKPGKRSIGMEVIDAQTLDWIYVGHVTIPPNHDIPIPGTIIEVEYLYAFPGGSLFQPVYKGQREDLGLEDVTSRQLKLKKSA